MKKLIVSLLAVAGLAACATDDVVRELDNRTAIAFDTFVENATRADNVSTTTDNITEFSVWAYMNEANGIVFNDELVSRSGDAWSYTNLQYWLAGNSYSFAAFAGDRDFVDGLPAEDAMGANGLGTITFTNENGTNDILYAQNYVESAAADQAPVSFQFDHLLSKVRFTFANGFANNNNKIVVKNIKMTSAEVAELNLDTDLFVPVTDAEYVWKNHAGTKTLEFGNIAAGAKVARGDKAISDEDRLVIPADATYEYTVNFDVEVYNGEQRGLQKSMEVKVSGIELVAGHSYNFVATINQENLNLNAIEFTVAVDEWEEFEFNGGAVEDEVRFVSDIDELQTILNAATGNTSVVLGADLKGNVTVPELAGATIAINGNGHNFDGTFALVGGSTYGEGTTIFENIVFETAGLNGYDAFIYCNEQNGNTRYPDNVTIKNCTFKGTDTAVAAKFRALKGNLVVENCKAEGIHSMLQLLSCGEASVLVDGVEVVDCGRGFSLQYSTNVIRNTNVKAASYGVRLEGGAAATTIENSTIEATQPVIVRKLTTAGYTVNVDAATELKTAEPYQVIFTKGSDDAAYVAPTVDFAFNGPATTTVFPNNYAAASSVEDLYAALANEEASVVALESDVNVSATTTPWVNINREVYIDTNENTLTVGNSANYGLFCNAGANVTLDADIVAQGGAIVARDGAQLVFNSGSVKIESASTSQRYVVYAYGAGTTVTINGGTFSFEAYKKRAYGYIADGATLYINGGVFGAASNHPNDPTAPFTGNVVIKGGTFGFNPSAWVADGYVATQNGSTWTVSKQ